MTRLYLFYLFIFANDDDDKNSDVKSIFKKMGSRRLNSVNSVPVGGLKIRNTHGKNKAT